MKFGEIFEYHKIPEWYNMYLNYELFKQKIELFSMKKKFDEVMKLPGYYFRLDDGQLVYLDLTLSNKQDANDTPVRVAEDIFKTEENSVDKLIDNQLLVVP